MRLLITLLGGLALVALTSIAALAASYSATVENGVQTVTLIDGSGEVQSTVVAPGLKAQCPAGRFLISMDTVRPPQTGTVVGRDLNNPSTPDIQSSFDPDPDAAHDYYGTNDDDILTLPSGDVLLIWGVHIDDTVSPKPGWFDLTYAAAGKFGPGARRGSFVYRSGDCGNSFQYVTKIDPAKIGDGLCGNPQPLGKPAPPATYANGGSDGQLSKVIGSSVVLTMDCVGRLRDPSKPGWVISSNFVGRVEVLRSTDEGSNWTTLGFIPGLNGDSGWRAGAVSESNGDLAFGLFNFLTFAKKQTNGTYKFDGTQLSTPAGFGWSDGSNPAYQAINGTRVLAHALTTRVPGGNDIALIYPATVKDSSNKSVDGYQMFVFDPSSNSFGEAAPVFPQVHAANHFLMHMVAIDPGNGPILLYWYDIDANANSATMRGRVIFEGGAYSPDFTVATTTYVNPPKYPQPQIVPYTFTTGSAWYGDYITAGGYPPHGIVPTRTQQYQFYPMWVQSDGTARYSHITVNRDAMVLAKQSGFIRYPVWRPGPPPVEIEKVIGEQMLRRGVPYEPDSAEIARLKLTPVVTSHASTTRQ